MKKHKTHKHGRRLVYEHLAVFVLSFAAMGGIALILSSRAATIYTAPASIAADCSRNVSSDISSWLASVPDGNTIQFAAGGCYRIDQTITILGRNNLTVDGRNSTFKTDDPTGDGSSVDAPSQAAGGRAHWRVTNGSNIVLKNMIIRGANAAGGMGDAAYRSSLEGQHAVDLHGVRNVEIAGVNASYMYGDCFYVGESSTNGWSDGVRIHDSRCEHTGRHGATVTAGRNVRVDNNYIGDIRYSTMDIEPNAPRLGASNVVFENNQVGAGRLQFFSVNSGGGPIDNVTIRNNHADRQPKMSFNGNSLRLGAITVEGNTFTVSYDNSQGKLFGISNVDGFTLLNNSFVTKTGKNMKIFSSVNSTGITARGNTLANGVDVADFDSASRVALLCGNRFTATAAFDQPVVCPTSGTTTPPSTPPAGTGGSSGSTGNGSSSQSDNGGGTSAPGGSGSSGSSSGNSASAQAQDTQKESVPVAVITAPAKAISQGINTVTDSKQPIARRIGAAVLLWAFIGAAIFAAWTIIRFILHVRAGHLHPAVALGLTHTIPVSVPHNAPGAVFRPSNHNLPY